MFEYGLEDLQALLEECIIMQQVVMLFQHFLVDLGFLMKHDLSFVYLIFVHSQFFIAFLNFVLILPIHLYFRL
jgi:hypothetical protein